MQPLETRDFFLSFSKRSVHHEIFWFSHALLPCAFFFLSSSFFFPLSFCRFASAFRLPTYHLFPFFDELSFVCLLFACFHLSPDINECQQSPPKCRPDQRCVNYPGGHYCTCQDGHRLNRLTNSCEGSIFFRL